MAQNQEGVTEEMSSFLGDLTYEIFYNPINLALIAFCAVLLYKIFCGGKSEDVSFPPPAPQLPPMRRRDMTNKELKQYDGTNEEGRICIAVNGKIFDVTRAKNFYGPGGSYGALAGRDATRCLATYSLEGAKDEYDDVSDLDAMQVDSAREWEEQFQEKYTFVGRLLKPGETPNEYSGDEEAGEDKK